MFEIISNEVCKCQCSYTKTRFGKLLLSHTSCSVFGDDENMALKHVLHQMETSFLLQLLTTNQMLNVCLFHGTIDKSDAILKKKTSKNTDTGISIFCRD